MPSTPLFTSCFFDKYVTSVAAFAKKCFTKTFAVERGVEPPNSVIYQRPLGCTPQSTPQCTEVDKNDTFDTYPSLSITSIYFLCGWHLYINTSKAELKIKCKYKN